MEINKVFVICSLTYLRAATYLAFDKETGYCYFTKDGLNNEIKTFESYEKALNFINEKFDSTTKTFYACKDDTPIKHLTVVTITTNINIVENVFDDYD